MKFWDTSALVPLCVEESQSESVKSILARDTALVVWWATRVECISALARQAREGGLSVAGEKQAREVLETLAEAWIEVQPSEVLRATAERLLAVHPLRASDSFQLAAALQWCQRQSKGMSLVSFDTRLRDAAYREGFTVTP
ncbi:MAG: type II toxin-antitoxin system VapC family toxin [Deltaproteobacteria bacterium]|nr:type II toxin-antitoxin system VapC family toxin [Deltaproteobacteria bacterium]